MKKIVIAIDGFVATGKGTIAEEIAKKYHLVHIDSGMFYRAIALETLLKGNDSIEKIIENIDLKWDDGKIFLSGNDVTNKLRTHEVTDKINSIVNIPLVRNFVTSFCQKLANDNSVIMDGRDIGNVILPNANLKFLLKADQEERVKRRLQQNIEKGIKTSESLVREDIELRDKRDLINMGNLDNHIIIDNTRQTVAETVKLMSTYIDKIIK